MRSALVLLLCVLSALGCDSLVDSVDKKLQGTAAPLKEATLPNCSRILTCCANLTAGKATGPMVKDQCPKVVTPTTTAIDKYQAARKAIQDNTTLTAEAKANSLKELESKTVGTAEPACRCLLQETVGKIGTTALPADCETVTTTGALPQGKQCSDVTDEIMNPK